MVIGVGAAVAAYNFNSSVLGGGLLTRRYT